VDAALLRVASDATGKACGLHDAAGLTAGHQFIARLDGPVKLRKDLNRIYSFQTIF
jgi:hypothetical protein